MDTSPDGAPRRASKPAEPRRSVAETRAAAAAAAGNVPVVFEYNPGPPPPQPGVQQRDDEVEARRQASHAVVENLRQVRGQ